MAEVGFYRKSNTGLKEEATDVEALSMDLGICQESVA